MRPSSPERPAGFDPAGFDPEDLAACREAIRVGSRSFYAASLLLPERVRASAYGLYAFCRLSDDAVDLDRGGAEAIARLGRRLDLVYAGRPQDAPADRMLAEVVARHRVPRELPEALVEGLAWDAEGRRFDEASELRAYAVRVAGSVGAMMALLMGVRTTDALARACDLGVAMQFTNIVRDVGEDARNGRLYLPGAWMREEGLDPAAWLANPVLDERLRRVLRRMLGAADLLYARAEAGIGLLPLDCRPAIHAAARIYAAIGRDAEAADLDVLGRRARVSGRRKGVLLGRSLLETARGAGRWSPPPACAVPPLEEAAFLIRAVDAMGPDPSRSPAEHGRPVWYDLAGRTARVIETFERLGRQEQFGG
ncbi:phytoene/squalene synthase family protein [Alsobacter sp. KACC 23698]|uniref:Phytoene/squalene synthase family protein n=1 Tax=Alsobacter sp. KACC 23698 TaxID=3149229 RepID=A0AAU7JEM0_9HYPH